MEEGFVGYKWTRMDSEYDFMNKINFWDISNLNLDYMILQV